MDLFLVSWSSSAGIKYIQAYSFITVSRVNAELTLSQQICQQAKFRVEMCSVNSSIMFHLEL